jgi:RNA polymerase sigma-70 factor, ECF subfamily
MSDPTVFMNSQPSTEESESPVVHKEPPVDWSSLVERIRAGEPAALEELYGVFSKGIRFYLCRQLGPQDLDDRVHDLYLTITKAIQNGELREPERLMGFVRTVVRRQVITHINVKVISRRSVTNLEDGSGLRDYTPDPERLAIQHQNSDIALRILNSISRRDREVLIRFYLSEQSPEQVCREMELTETQFRLIKCRAKARFGEMGKARLLRRHGFAAKSQQHRFANHQPPCA